MLCMCCACRKMYSAHSTSKRAITTIYCPLSVICCASSANNYNVKQVFYSCSHFISLSSQWMLGLQMGWPMACGVEMGWPICFWSKLVILSLMMSCEHRCHKPLILCIEVVTDLIKSREVLDSLGWHWTPASSPCPQLCDVMWVQAVTVCSDPVQATSSMSIDPEPWPKWAQQWAEAPAW